MSATASILVLGAYGLAGRAIVERLAERTDYSILAAGRNAEKLDAVLDTVNNHRVSRCILDASDPPALRDACANVSFVINAVGPFAQHGAGIARAVVECERPYLDCANEQCHYRRLTELDALARRNNVPMITAAGAIPGVSTLLMAQVLRHFPEAAEMDCCWAQFRNARAESGLGSVMGGILEATDRPETMIKGKLSPMVIGHSSREFDLPGAFGRKRLLEVPTIDNLTLPARFALREMHTWFYMGDLPTWLLGMVRLLQPNRRPWAYRFIETIMRRVNDQETQKAIASNVGPEGLLWVEARNQREIKSSSLLFRDGAIATACLPAYIADRYLRGQLVNTGLLTPLGLLAGDELPEITKGAVIESDT